MKIGIITFWTTKDNYGQILQCFALQQYLRNHGHEPFLIRYMDSPKEAASFKWNNLFKYIIQFPKYISWFITQKLRQHSIYKYTQETVNINRQFDMFINEHIAHTESIYTEESIKEAPLADAYICGSDQVWGGDWAYYLDFAPDDKLKIAYAPSLGGLTSFAQEYEEYMTILLQRFAFIGMREQSGVEVCHRLGRKDAVKVVDPTLLLTKADYDKIRIAAIKNCQKPYLFAYFLGNPVACDMKDVYAYAKSKGLEVKYVTSGQVDGYEHIYPQIGEWIDLIANAEVVITNSFHGTVFSLIYETPFITIPLNRGFERMNTRVIELLDCANLKNRLYQDSFDTMSDEVDFTVFRNYRKNQEEISTSYLNPIIK